MASTPALDLNTELLYLQDRIVEEVFRMMKTADLNRPQMEQHAAFLCSGLWNRIERRINASRTTDRPRGPSAKKG